MLSGRRQKQPRIFLKARNTVKIKFLKKVKRFNLNLQPLSIR